MKKRSNKKWQALIAEGDMTSEGLVTIDMLKTMAKDYSKSRLPQILMDEKGNKIGSITEIFIKHKILWGVVKYD